jgi:hypothetical protein
MAPEPSEREAEVQHRLLSVLPLSRQCTLLSWPLSAFKSQRGSVQEQPSGLAEEQALSTSDLSALSDSKNCKLSAASTCSAHVLSA